MAWPQTPLTTYLPGTTPWISAADLNAFQAGVTGIVNGTYSLAGFKVDGVGGTVVAAPAGTGQVSAELTAVGFPGPVVAVGQFGKAGVPLGYAYVRGTDGVVLQGYNVYSSTRTAVGRYTVVFHALAAFRSRNCIWVSSVDAVGLITKSNASPTASGARQGALISGYATTGLVLAPWVDSDHDFFVMAWGE